MSTRLLCPLFNVKKSRVRQKFGKLVNFRPFKSHWKEVFKTPLTLVNAIILAHLVAVQSLRIFKISPNCVI